MRQRGQINVIEGQGSNISLTHFLQYSETQEGG